MCLLLGKAERKVVLPVFCPQHDMHLKVLSFKVFAFIIGLRFPPNSKWHSAVLRNSRPGEVVQNKTKTTVSK